LKNVEKLEVNLWENSSSYWAQSAKYVSKEVFNSRKTFLTLLLLLLLLLLISSSSSVFNP